MRDMKPLPEDYKWIMDERVYLKTENVNYDQLIDNELATLDIRQP